MRGISCGCSLCGLYLRDTTDLGDLDFQSEYALKQICFEDRKYQTALIEYGKTHNIMACLPTGSGKTFIALKLIEHYKPSIISEGKKVFFLANTIPLVNQQAAYIARNSSLKVRHLTGDMDVDYWSKPKFEAIVNEFQVMAMTAQIFLNMIRHEYVRFSQIAFLVFDECHHAVEKHPMAEIMKEYARARQMDPNYILPRVLGLSATIIKGTCKPSEVESKIMELESTMNSAALTYKDYEEVLSHSTSSKIEKVSVSLDNYYAEQHNIAEMESLSKQLQELRKERKKAKLGAAKLTPECLDPRLTTFDNMYNLIQKKPSPGDLKVALDDVLHVYTRLGLYCTVIAINLRLAFIEFSLMDINDGTVKSWYEKIQSYLRRLKSTIEDNMPENAKANNSLVISKKLKILLDKLEEYKRYESESTPVCAFGSDNRLCGLVFTDRRATAQVLAWYLIDLAKLDDYKFIRAGFVVGTSRSAFESVETRVYAKKQTETLNKFRNKELNILTATSVLEEGIDVPSCNLVVRFDPVHTYTSFIQSMGRARRKGASFIAMLPENDYYKLSEKLDTFQEINKRIIEHLIKNVEKIDADNHQIRSSWEIDAIPPICPGGLADSPKITIDSAAGLAERYCMLLPSDGISSLQTLSWWTQCASGNYQASLKLPLNSVVRSTIVGQPMKNKELAKQAADMKACQMLLDLNVFNDNLIPVHPTLNIAVERFFQNLVPLPDKDAVDQPEEGEIRDQPNKENAPPSVVQVFKNKWYSKQIPKVLTDTKLSAGSKYYVYKLNFELFEKRTESPWENLFDAKNVHEGFAIITSLPLPNIGTFPLYSTFGTIHCSLGPFKLKTKTGNPLELDKRLIDNMKYAQHKMFSDLLGIKNAFFGNFRDVSYLIVPLIKDSTGEWRINERIEEDIQQLESIQNTKPPRRPRDQSVNRSQPDTSSSSLNKFRNTVIFPWYKKPKPAYLVEAIDENITTLSEFRDKVSFKDHLETRYKTVKIQNPNQHLLKCKFAGIALGRLEKDPIQLNYLLKKFNKEDDDVVYLVPDLCFSISVPATFIILLKLLPSVLHRISRLLIAHELLVECSNKSGWPQIKCVNDVVPEVNELNLLSSAHAIKSKDEEERRKRRIELRNEMLRPKKRKPAASNKHHIDDRDLHYEFVHPNEIRSKDIKLFHEAVSIHNSAKKLTLASAEVEIVNSNLSITSEFELLDMDVVDDLLVPLDKVLNAETDFGPSLLTVMEALSTKVSNEGLAEDRLKHIGSSFLSFAVSLFAYSNYPSYGEPILCQLRNRTLTIQIMNVVATKSGLPEMISGSNFHPDKNFIPPGKELTPNFLGEIAAKNNVHLNVFDEIPLAKIKEMTYKELEDFADKKFKETGLLDFQKAAAESILTDKDKQSETASTSTVGPSNPKPLTSQKKKEPPIKYAVKHSTFTHTSLNDFDIVNGMNSVIGAFFGNGGAQGAYKILQWLNFQMPDIEGNGRDLNDFSRSSGSKENFVHLNPNNGVHLLYQQFESLEKIIKYEFNNKDLLVQAFTHPTYPGHNLNECYQRLEFLGDSILDLLLTNFVFTQNPGDKSSEDLQNIRAALVNCVTYSSLSVRYGFHKYLLSMSKPLADMIDNFVVCQESVKHHVIGHFTLISDEECRGPKHIEVPKVLNDIWEALAGAIFLDSGNSLDAVWRVYYRLMQNELDVFWKEKQRAPIHELKALMQAEDIEVTYKRCTGKKGQARGRELVRVDVGVYGHYFGTGTTHSRAKESAAKIALKLIKQENLFIKDPEATKIMLLLC